MLAATASLAALMYTQAAPVRWLARLALERPQTTIGELQLAATALAQLSERPKAAARMLRELAT